MDVLTKELGGCGPFQFAIFPLLYSVKVYSAFCLMFMSFGNLNPGWTCLDNNTIEMTSFYLAAELMNTSSFTANMNSTDNSSCDVFKSCKNVKFSERSTTIVTEWNLVCDDAWISSFIICIQMLGFVLGAFISGRLGDRIGRRLTIYGSLASSGFFHLLASFSLNWKMFAFMNFLIGLTLPSLNGIAYILTMEFTTRKWRECTLAIPDWALSCVIFSVTASQLQSWRHFCIINAVAAFLVFLPVFWIPESIRWLAVNGKVDRTVMVAEKVARTNQVPVPDSNKIKEIVVVTGAMKNKPPKSRYVAIFQNGLMKSTCIIGFQALCLGLNYYAITFGLKSLFGDFYLNLVLSGGLQLLSPVAACIAARFIGRKRGILVIQSIVILCFCTIFVLNLVGTDENGQIATTALAMTGRLFTEAVRGLHDLLTVEVYPTVVRSYAISFSNLAMYVGATLAPFLIPLQKTSVYICYLMMGVLTLTCNTAVFFLPETRCKPMRDGWGCETDSNILKMTRLNEHKSKSRI